MNGFAHTGSLIFQDESKDPGLHALVIGVSAYDYLTDGPYTPIDEPMLSLSRQLRQLSGPAQSARSLADFLLARKDMLAKPLRTLRLLASPSPSEAGPAFAGVMPATMDNVATALKDWQSDARRSDNDVTFLYFAGHGTQRSKWDAILLLQDFLGGPTVFDRTIDVGQIYYGMARSKFIPTIAQTQFYFIDACRVDYDLYRDIQRTGMRSVFTIQDLGSDQRIAPIFFAAGPGQETKALPSQQTTRFGRRLLQCLRSDGAEKINNKWVITTGRLAKALDMLSHLEELSTGEKIDSFDVDKWRRDSTIVHTLDAPPTIQCTFRFEPSDARKGCSIILEDLTPSKLNFPPELRDPHTEPIPAGIYTISLEPVGKYPKAYIEVLPPFRDVSINEGGIS